MLLCLVIIKQDGGSGGGCCHINCRDDVEGDDARMKQIAIYTWLMTNTYGIYIYILHGPLLYVVTSLSLSLFEMASIGPCKGGQGRQSCSSSHRRRKHSSSMDAMKGPTVI